MKTAANFLYEELTEKIIKACFEVSNELGADFLESVYHNALLFALQEKRLKVESEYPVTVTFRGTVVGHFSADLLVEDKVIVELKAVSALTNEHKAQVINYLKACNRQIGLLINFGRPRIEYHRLHNPNA